MPRNLFAAALAACLSTLVRAEQFVVYSGGDTGSTQRMDAIVNPGTISAHVHEFLGSSALNADMTYESLQSTTCTTVGSADGRGLAADNSVYWHPALYAEAKDGSGYLRIPVRSHKIYYQNTAGAKDQKRDPFEFPKGFRMVAGHKYQRAAATDVKKQNITQWICHQKGGRNQGTDGGFPNGFTDCDSYPGFNGAIHFPQCWNGKDFDSADPEAHMSYPDGDVTSGPCPSSHPTRLPRIFMENEFDVHEMKDLVKPDSYVLAHGDATGYGWHADFFNGWEEGAIPALLASCPDAKFGNQDAGICGSFKARSTKAKDCKLPVEFEENVDKPGQSLPGCNPISTVNPAPKLPIALLGSTTCPAGSGDGNSSPIIAPPSIVSTISSAPFTQAPPSAIPSAVLTTVNSAPLAFGAPTTLATSYRPVDSSTSAAPASAPSEAAPVPYEAVPLPNEAPPTSYAVTCPAANGTTYTSNGATFEIECGIDHVAGDMGMKYVKGGLTECIDRCASTSGCVDVSLSGTACYLKKSLGNAKVKQGVNGAKLISGAASTTSTRTMPTGFARNDRVNYVVVTEVQTVTAQVTAYA